MPWVIVRKDGKSCVCKKASGEVVKCHDKRRDALAHLRALYANVPEARQEDKK